MTHPITSVTSSFKLSEDLNDCISDTADNYTHSHPDHYLLDSTIFQALLFSILQGEIEKLIIEFSTNPEKYISHQQQTELDRIASESIAHS